MQHIIQVILSCIRCTKDLHLHHVGGFVLLITAVAFISAVCTTTAIATVSVLTTLVGLLRALQSSIMFYVKHRI